MRQKVAAIIRDALEVIADLPRRVVDPHWIETLDNEATSSKPRRAAK
jgi:hypothetical protein